MHNLTREVLESWKHSGPRVSIEPETFCDMLGASRASRIEVSGFSRARMGPAGIEVYSEAYIPEQECSANHTTDPLGPAMAELQAEGKNVTEYNCWWHSHVNSSAYMSGTDVYAMWQFMRHLRNGPVERDEILGPLVAIVLNIKADALAWVCFAKPDVVWRDLPVRLSRPMPENAFSQLLAGRQPRMAQIVEKRVRKGARR